MTRQEPFGCIQSEHDVLGERYLIGTQTSPHFLWDSNYLKVNCAVEVVHWGKRNCVNGLVQLFDCLNRWSDSHLKVGQVQREIDIMVFPSSCSSDLHRIGAAPYWACWN